MISHTTHDKREDRKSINGFYINRSDYLRFIAKIKQKNGCWEWMGTRRSNYGRFRVGGKYGRLVDAHRFSFVLFKSELGELDVLHKCDNPCCVNPKHLKLGTHKENMADRDAKGRMRPPPKGDKHHSNKLTNEDVLQIRAQYKNGATPAELARKYRVSGTNISLIVKWKIWRHLSVS